MIKTQKFAKFYLKYKIKKEGKSVITREQLDEALVAIECNNDAKIIEMALTLYNKVITNNYKIENIKEEFQKKIMEDIESNKDLNLYLRKEARVDGKYEGKLWSFIINNSVSKTNIKFFIQNCFMYFQNENDFKEVESVFYDRIIKVKDFETLLFCINNRLITESQIENIIKQINQINYINWFIAHRKEYTGQVSLDGLITIAGRINRTRYLPR